MRILTYILSVPLAAIALTNALAWQRATVEREIVDLCELRNDDDWPGQEDCIVAQRHALQSLRPPKNDKELIEASRSCTSASVSDYDFVSIQDCYDKKAEEIIHSREEDEVARQHREFLDLPLIVRCTFSNSRTIEIRRSRAGPDAIEVLVRPGSISAGQSREGYSYVWDKGSSKLDGNQLQEGGSGNRYAGKCDYQR